MLSPRGEQREGIGICRVPECLSLLLNWLPPNPLPRKRVCVPPIWILGGYTRLRGEGVGGSQFRRPAGNSDTLYTLWRGGSPKQLQYFLLTTYFTCTLRETNLNGCLLLLKRKRSRTDGNFNCQWNDVIPSAFPIFARCK